MSPPTPTDFRKPTPEAVLQSILRWGAALNYDRDENTEARRLSRGVGLVWSDWEPPGRFPGPDELQVEPVAASMLRPALEAGEAWSTALERVRAEDPESPWVLSYLLHAGNTFSGGPVPGNKPTASYPPWDFGADIAFWDPTSNPPYSIAWWKVWRFPHPSAHVLAAVRKLEAAARELLSSDPEPAAVRELRNAVAAAGHPATLEDARAAYARGRGLSETEANQLRNPTMPRPTTIRADSLSRSFSVLQGARAADVVPRMGDAPAPTKGEERTFGAWTPTVYGGAVGAVVGGLLGRLVTGSFGMGAGLGAAGGAVVGGGGAYIAAGGDI